MTLDDLPARPEQLIVCHDRESGLRGVIAIDDTTLGPGVGGVRYRPYPTLDAAAVEATRLAHAMTLKNAMAELPFGGAKAVLLLDCPPADRAATMRTFGAWVERLGGAYVPGVDMGTTTQDLATIATVARDVACTGDDPAPWTALGVYSAIRAALTALGDGRLAGVHVAVQGAGSVGEQLIGLLREQGARVSLSDTDRARAETVAGRYGNEVVAPDDIVTLECDVLAPCAIAGVISPTNAASLRCRVVAGAANDTLTDPRAADALVAAGITFVPDFVASAGGVIHIEAERSGWSEDALRRAVCAIGDRVGDALEEAARSGLTPPAAAERRARAIIAARASVAA
jgi:leucine dehydrogenase